MDHARLRTLLRLHIGALKDRGTHDELPAICSQLGIPSPIPEGSKRERMYASFDATLDEALPGVARQLIARFAPPRSLRNEIQELLWADEPGPPIPKRFRREIAQSLEASDLYIDAEKFDDLITSLFDIEDTPPLDFFDARRKSLRAQINQHVYRNPGDWTPEDLFERLGAYECSARRFCLFLEGLASADVRPDEASQRWFIERVNESLRPCGVSLRETGTNEGYPVFAIVPHGVGPAGRAKNLIFASSDKPDLRFRDAVNNDIEIVSNADRVLIYDRPIGAEGLRWSDLQAWWAERERLEDPEQAKQTLYRRLRKSLPSNSPPQLLLFEAFFKKFGRAVPHLPALLPEVWLHWDPKTAAERGADALARFRMDFLLLLPRGPRVVIEVDGKHHYADQQGRASAQRYAAMMVSDRELRLAGYEVFRFGAAELDDEGQSKAMVGEFFAALFKRYGVSMTG
jgi:hypothetical protein